MCCTKIYYVLFEYLIILYVSVTSWKTKIDIQMVNLIIIIWNKIKRFFENKNFTNNYYVYYYARETTLQH